MRRRQQRHVGDFTCCKCQRAFVSFDFVWAKPYEVTKPSAEQKVCLSCANDVTPGAPAVEPHVEPHAPTTIDAMIEQRVEAVVAARLREFKPTTPTMTITIVPEPPRPPVTVEGQHPAFGTLMGWLALRQHVLLLGPPGAGKTTAAGAALNLVVGSHLVTSLAPLAGRSEVVGFIDAHGKIQSVPFRDAYVGTDACPDGQGIVLDELDNGSPGVFVSVNSAIENGRGNFCDGVRDRAKNFLIVATANTLAPAAGHEYRVPLDRAFLDRFVIVEWGYDTEYETRIARSLNPDVPVAWIEKFYKVREHVASRQMDVVVSPRVLYRGASWLRMFPDANLSMLMDTLLGPTITDDAARAAVRVL